MITIEIAKTGWKKAIETAVRVLKNNGLIVYPTETVYGLGALASSETAVEKLWQFKGERGDKPVLCAVSNQAMAERYVDLTDLGKSVVQKYWPGAVAVVALSKNKVAKKAQGASENLGLRCPNMKEILEIISILGEPMTSTSANVSGAETAKSLAEFLERTPMERLEMVDLFLDVGELPARMPSTIVDVTGINLTILRQGEVEVEI